MISYLLIHLDALATLIPIFFLFKYKNTGLLKELLALFLYLIFQFVLLSAADILSDYQKENYFLFHINLPLSFLALLFFFKQHGKEVFYSSFLFRVGIFLTLFFVLDSFLFEHFNIFNSLSYSLGSLYILVICMNYFWMQVKSGNTSDILRQASFWIMSGLFIYYCSSFIVFCSYKFFIESNNQLAGIVWRFHNIMMLIMCTLMTKGITCQQKYQVI